MKSIAKVIFLLNNNYCLQKLRVLKYFSAQEEKDGVSPPVLEEVIKYKKNKAVTFQDTLHNQSNTVNNTSSSNTSGDDLNKSGSNHESIALRTVKVEERSDKEN